MFKQRPLTSVASLFNHSGFKRQVWGLQSCGPKFFRGHVNCPVWCSFCMATCTSTHSFSAEPRSAALFPGLLATILSHQQFCFYAHSLVHFKNTWLWVKARENRHVRGNWGLDRSTQWLSSWITLVHYEFLLLNIDQSHLIWNGLTQANNDKQFT